MDVQQTLSIIEHQEQVLVFDAFDNHDALLLGMRLAEQVKESERPVAIRIYLGDVLVFQYMNCESSLFILCTSLASDIGFSISSFLWVVCSLS